MIACAPSSSDSFVKPAASFHKLVPSTRFSWFSKSLSRKVVWRNCCHSAGISNFKVCCSSCHHSIDQHVDCLLLAAREESKVALDSNGEISFEASGSGMHWMVRPLTNGVPCNTPDQSVSFRTALESSLLRFQARGI